MGVLGVGVGGDKARGEVLDGSTLAGVGPGADGVAVGIMRSC